MNILNKFLVSALSSLLLSTASAGDSWVIDSQEEWQNAAAEKSALEFKKGFAEPTAEKAVFKSKIKTFSEKRSADSITFDQFSRLAQLEPGQQCRPLKFA